MLSSGMYMLLSGTGVLSGMDVLSYGGSCYHLGEGCYHLRWECYHLGLYVIIWDEMLSSGTGVLSSEMDVLWGKMLSSGRKCYHLGWTCYHLGEVVIIWDGSVIIRDGHVII